jgi:hypothetical protein
MVDRDRADVTVTTVLHPLIVTAVLGGEGYTEDLKKISVPILAMNGDGDQVVPYTKPANPVP